MGNAEGSDTVSAGITRRDVLRGAAGVAAAGGVSGVLAACGSSSSSSSGDSVGTSGAASVSGGEATGAPVRGGTLNFGAQGQSSSDTIEAQNPISNADFVRTYQLYSPLVRIGSDFDFEYDLAEEIIPNKDATEWVIKVRPGVTFHNGKDLSAKDVLFTFNRMRAEEFGGNTIMAPLDLKRAKVMDAHTLKLPCSQPFSNFVEAMCSSPYFMMVPEGYDPAKPVGTGPFKYKSFTPGQQSDFVRFDDYWEKGLPYLDGVVTQDFADEQSQINALLSGSIDLTNLLSGQSVKTLEGGGATVVVSTGGTADLFDIRCDKPPFNDVRVRTAMREAVDREQMNQLVFEGKGLMGNDLFGYGDPAYNSALPQREGDPEKAKSLLKQAGYSDGLDVQLTTTGLSQGTLALSQVLAQQAKTAGFNVELRELTLTNFFDGYLTYDFNCDYINAGFVLGFAPLNALPTAPFNAAKWKSAKFAKLYAEATATTDKQRQTELVHAMQQIEYSEGGYLIPVLAPLIDAHTGKVGGVPALTKAQWPCNNYNFRSMWLAS